MWYLFFLKQKTAYERRMSDWSSDVCSSDLAAVLRGRWARGASGGAGVVGFAGFGAAVGPRGVLPGCGMRARPIGGGCGVAECWGGGVFGVCGWGMVKFLFSFSFRGLCGAGEKIGRQRVSPRRGVIRLTVWARSEEHTSELQSLMRISYADCCS